MKDLILRSGRMTAYVNAFGAEIKGLSLDGIEFLFEGDPDYYDRTSPTLFPIIGRFLSDTYYDGDQAYHIMLNGFAMNRNFSVKSLSEDSVCFALRSDGNTLRMYPYPFELNVNYSLAENRLNVCYTVMNTGPKTMPFCVGCHTAYRWPLFPGENPNEYELRFEKSEDLESFNPFNWKQEHFVCGTKKALSHDLFSNYTRSMTNIRSEWIEFANPANGHGVRIHRAEMPYLAMWTLPDEDAHLVCIEPCTSVHAGGATTMMDRMGVLFAEPGEKKDIHFSIELF